jgi:hypothetical protein
MCALLYAMTIYKRYRGYGARVEPVTAAALAATIVPLATGTAGVAGQGSTAGSAGQGSTAGSAGQGSAAGSAGQDGTAAWSELTAFAERHDETAAALTPVQDTPGDPARVGALADALAALAARDPEAGAWLQNWLADADRLVDVPHIPETVSDPVHGSVTQPQV